MNPLVESKLKELLGFAEKHGLMEVAWQDKGVKIAFRRRNGKLNGNGASSVLEVDPVSEEITDTPVPIQEFVVRSPMVGMFRRGQGKGRPPLVMEGNHVKPGDRVGIVECMKIPTDVISYNGGEIKKILVEDGQAVEYGQPLFVLNQTGIDGSI